MKSVRFSTWRRRGLAPLLLSLAVCSVISGVGRAYAGTYAEWVQAHHLPWNLSSETNAPAGDGVPNLLKFLLGLDPMTPAPRPLPPLFQPILVEGFGVGVFTLYPTSTNLFSAQGVRFNFYVSQDLRTWTPYSPPYPLPLEPPLFLVSTSRVEFVRWSVEFNSFDRFITGPAVPVMTNSVGPGGATLTVPATGSPLDGLVLQVPAGAYTNQQTVAISYAPIAAHNFPASLNPVTPLIHIDNGGALASQPMTVTVPVSLATNEFAMGFSYHPDTGELEGMPLLALSTNSITVATRHFSDFFISKIPFSLLPNSVDSGFRPGVDDWEFENDGTFLTPDGQCSGQSQSAMWYYCEQTRNGAPHLYNLYDNSLYSFLTPDFGDDNVVGLKLAARVEADTDWDSLANWFWDNSGVSDWLTLEAFTYSIWVTGEPQGVGLYAPGSGHAVVAYRVWNGFIFVADPNYPGVTSRVIDYDAASGSFLPYLSGATAADSGTAYTNIIYAAKSSVNNWDQIGLEWLELFAGTIGAADFPVFQISVTELQNGNVVDVGKVTTDQPTEKPIRTGADEVQVGASYVSGPAIDGDAEISVFDTDGYQLDYGGWVPLASGTNELGVEVSAKTGTAADASWAGFAWLTVVRTNQDWIFAIQEDTVFDGPRVVTNYLDGDGWECGQSFYAYKDTGLQTAHGHFFDPSAKDAGKHIQSIWIDHAGSTSDWTNILRIDGNIAPGGRWERSTPEESPTNWEIHLIGDDSYYWPNYIYVKATGDEHARKQPLVWWEECSSGFDRNRREDWKSTGANSVQYWILTEDYDWQYVEFYFGDGVWGDDLSTNWPDGPHTDVSFIPHANILGLSAGQDQAGGAEPDADTDAWHSESSGEYYYYDIFRWYKQDCDVTLPHAWSVRTGSADAPVELKSELESEPPPSDLPPFLDGIEFERDYIGDELKELQKRGIDPPEYDIQMKLSEP